MAKHLASYGLLGPITGKRLGTRFVFKPEDINSAHNNPYFKWRNDDARREYREWRLSQDGGQPEDDAVCETPGMCTHTTQIEADSNQWGQPVKPFIVEVEEILSRQQFSEYVERAEADVRARLDWFEGELAKADEWKAHNKALREALEHAHDLMFEYGFSSNDLRPIRAALGAKP